MVAGSRVHWAVLAVGEVIVILVVLVLVRFASKGQIRRHASFLSEGPVMSAISLYVHYIAFVIW